MAKPTQGSRRSAPWHRRLVGLLLFLLPAGVMAGLFAPGVVRVVAEKAVTAAAKGVPRGNDSRTSAAVTTPLRQYAFEPSLQPSDFGIGVATRFQDLDQVFVDPYYRLDSATGRYARLLAFPRNHGDSIVLDGTERYAVTGVRFRDALGGSVAEPGFGDKWEPFALGSPIPMGDGLHFDDFPGSHTLPLPPLFPVPEPGTGSLLGVGLLMLAWQRRPQRQPTGS